ncbi:MAG: peptidoglycan DD-metalloendopeptidase family protein [Candidatus Magasanikbacteria bacterium]|nr:peptidoglycan DD-metalloendopeptidase family protein [Candidatus Magasanikbacteria bacterium]
MNKRYFFSIIAILAGIFCIPFFALAEPSAGQPEIEVLNKAISARQDKIKQLEDTISKYKKNIAEKQSEAVSLKNQMSILDNHIAQAQTDIDLIIEKIKQAALEIEALQIDINDKLNTIARQKQIVATLVKNIHASDQKNYLEIMLSYQSFAQFYDELKQTENVYTDVGRALKNVRLAKEQLERKREQVGAKQNMYQALQDELQNKKDNLTSENTYKQKLLADTKNKESIYRTLLESQKREYQVVEREIRTFEDQVRKKLAEQDKIAASGLVSMIWPTPSHIINATFHDPEYPFRRVFEHSGLDLKAPQGTPIRAAAPGFIAKARRCSVASCYSYILLVHTGNLSTLYGHLSKITISDDEFINQGDVIGYSGGTPGTVGAGPFVTGPHLHFEVRLNGIPVDPLGYL